MVIGKVIHQRIGAAEHPQILDQSINAQIGQTNHVGIHHRLQKTGLEYRIAQIVHINECMSMGLVINFCPGGSQFDQRVRAKSREQQKPARFQNPHDFFERVGRIRPRQNQISKDKIETMIFKR